MADLDPMLLPLALRVVPPEELARRRRAAAALLEAARPHLEWLVTTDRVEPCVAIVVDPEGIVLDSTDPGDARLGALVRPGADWSEGALGTNGAGTALAAREPVMVRGPEHFLGMLRGYVCAGAPVRDRDGAVLGAVDVTAAMVPGAGADRLRLVAHVAFAIEQALRRRAAPA